MGFVPKRRKKVITYHFDCEAARRQAEALRSLQTPGGIAHLRSHWELYYRGRVAREQQLHGEVFFGLYWPQTDEARIEMGFESDLGCRIRAARFVSRYLCDVVIRPIRDEIGRTRRCVVPTDLYIGGVVRLYRLPEWAVNRVAELEESIKKVILEHEAIFRVYDGSLPSGLQAYL